ncbi:hypothetical protein HHL21_03725 [Massilia sp. RP-1-19]|uniref:DUF2946 domain-containing protein n=1 Tax=Massilia polaris TaxID=2728846 RepID=A0A848HJ97_9BURK|nr:hypothetical protein [Massilia polaris]NML60209.1 hypothetical protein [Massilia polaris]
MLHFATMKSLKSIFVWILLLALPLQGFAAVSMFMCDSGAAKVVAAATAVADDAASGMPAGCEHHKAKQAPGDDKPGSLAKCGTCASCPVGAAIVTVLIPLPQINSHGAERIPYVAAYDTACIVGALERPPHTVA